MSLAKARDLMRLAEMAAARHQGVSLAEIAEEFGADHRTAQRMARALEDTFPGVEIRTDEDRRRRWKLRDPGLARFQGVRDDELAALEMSIRRAEREGAAPDVAALAALRDRLLACMPGPHARRAEADAEALLEAQGFAARPGPAVRAEPGVLETIAEALKGPFLLAITYAGADGIAAERRVAPHGVLLGMRRYLVARDEDRDPALAPLPRRPDPDRAPARLELRPPARLRHRRPRRPRLRLVPGRGALRRGRLALRARARPRPPAPSSFTPASGWRTSRTARSSCASRPRAGSRWPGTSTSGATPSRSWPRRACARWSRATGAATSRRCRRPAGVCARRRNRAPASFNFGLNLAPVTPEKVLKPSLIRLGFPPACHAGGRGFEPRQPRHYFNSLAPPSPVSFQFARRKLAGILQERCRCAVIRRSRMRMAQAAIRLTASSMTAATV